MWTLLGASTVTKEPMRGVERRWSWSAHHHKSSDIMLYYANIAIRTAELNQVQHIRSIYGSSTTSIEETMTERPRLTPYLAINTQIYEANPSLNCTGPSRTC